MSLLLSHHSKLCFRKPVFARSSPLLSSGFSSSLPQTQTPPCVIMYVDPCGAGLVIRKAVEDKKVPLKEMGAIGSCNGWVATLKDGLVNLNPVASDTDPKRIPLPPLVSLPDCQTQIVTNVAMSSSSPEDEDCVVAVKFLGPQISFCRPAQNNSKWTNIRSSSQENQIRLTNEVELPHVISPTNEVSMVTDAGTSIFQSEINARSSSNARGN